MKKKILSAALALLLLFAASLPACAPPKTKKYSATSFEFFDTVTTVIGYAEDQEAFDYVFEKVKKELLEYHKLYHIYQPYDGMENLYTVNQKKDRVKVDERIIDLLLYAKEVYEKTKGAVNVAMGSVLSLWHACRTEAKEVPDLARIPSKEALLEASKHTDINDVIIDTSALTVTLSDPMLSLDVGAVAKGYAVERVALDLEREGITGCVINVGGNVRTIGLRGDGEPWSVGIEDPSGEGDTPYVATLSLGSSSLVTSGNYQRYYEVDGVRYHHIIDPDTLMPARGFASVSVVGRDSAFCDALSTALFCMNHEEGLALVESMEGFEALWVTEDGRMLRSSGFSAYEK